MSNTSLNIIGAGLSGSLLSIFLANRGYQVTVYERSSDMRITENDAGRSINLALAHRGIRALKKACVYHYIKPHLIPMPGRQIHNADGSQLYQAYSGNTHEVNYSLSRSELNKQLMNAAEDTGQVQFRFEHECLGMEFSEENKAQVILLDKKSGSNIGLDAEHIFATDGAGSRIRRALVEQGHLSNRDELLDHDYKELTIPAGPENSYLIKKEALHIWPRGQYMLIALPNTDATFTVTLFMPKQGKNSFAELTSPQAVNSFFKDKFPSALEFLPELSTEFFENPQGILGTVYTNPHHWGDNVLLIGDSAHAVVPFHGQGMNCAFEDCIVLDELMDEYAADWKTVFRKYSLIRKANSDAIAQMALENYITMRDSVRHPDFHLRKRVSWELEKRFPEHFIPRYSMVMFHHVPYAECLRRGTIHEEILTELTAEISDVDALNLDKAKELITKRLDKINPEYLSGL